MATPTAQQAAANWGTGLQSKTERMKQGAMAVTVAPGQAAARQKAAWLANLQASADKWARNVAAVPLASWQEAFTTTGIDRIASGVQKGQGKVENFMNQFLPFLDQTKKSLPPRGTFEQNLARAAAQIRATHGFTYNRQA